MLYNVIKPFCWAYYASKELITIKKILKRLVRNFILCYYYFDNKLFRKFYRRRAKFMTTNNGIGEVDSVEFAIYLEKKARESGKDVNVTKIQKWLYICYGLFLAAENKPLLNERPRAWDYGPVFPRVYKKQSRNNNSLSGLEKEINTELLEKYNDIIDVTVEHFGDWTATQLGNWTHEKGSAWDKQFNDGKKYAPMDNWDIFIDFKGFVVNA